MNDDSSDTSSLRNATPSAEVIVDGVAASPGIVSGAVHRYNATTPEVRRDHVEPDEVDDEIALLDQAIQQATDELEKVQSVAQDRLDPDSEAIFEAQAMMLRDEEILQAIHQRIRDQHESAPHALHSVLHEHRKRLEDSDKEYLRQRAGDLKELEHRLLRGLERGQVATSIEPNSIVVAERLTAADVLRFSQHGMLGFVTVRGGHTSHVSIIARALNVPAVVGATGALDAVADQAPVILDGFRGRMIVHPEDKTRELYRRRRTQQQSLAEGQDSLTDRPAETTDGHLITLRANVEFGETLDTLGDHGAEGIGLMRTEMLFLKGRDQALTEEEQFDVYRRAAEQTGEHGASIRLLDLGGDKLLPGAQQEDNPFLGWRGIRLLLDRPEELLRPQVRALLRASAHGTLRLMVPMVTQLDDVRRVRSLVETEADRLAAEGREHDADLPIGIMAEVPSVALQAEAFAEVADFMSIGTNDLTQYVLAVDRGNDRVADRFDALHPAVLGLIKRIVEAGRSTGTPVSLCGEIASDAYAVPILVGLGLDVLSAPPPYLPAVKRVLTEIAYEDAKELAEEACAAPDAQTVRRKTREWVGRRIDSAHVQDGDPSRNGTEDPGRE